jgi:hypothetical protein
MRSMVEGAISVPAPSTPLRAVPPAAQGRIRQTIRLKERR